MPTVLENTIKYKTLPLTEVAGEGGPDLAPQKFLLSYPMARLNKHSLKF